MIFGEKKRSLKTSRKHNKSIITEFIGPDQSDSIMFGIDSVDSL